MFPWVSLGAFGVIGYVLAHTAGFYTGWGVMLLTLSLLAYTAAFLVDRRAVRPPGKAFTLTLWLLVTAQVFWLSRNPLLFYPRSELRLRALNASLDVLFAAALAGLAMLALQSMWPSLRAWVSRTRLLGWPLFWAMAIACLILKGSVLAISPDPAIDVFSSGMRGVQHLLQGRDPYAQDYPDLYKGTAGYKPTFFYGPGYLAWVVPGWLLGDLRFANLAAEILALTALIRLSRPDRAEARPASPATAPAVAPRAVPAAAPATASAAAPTAATAAPAAVQAAVPAAVPDAAGPPWVALLWLTFPAGLFMLEQAWVDSILLMALGWMWVACRSGRFGLAGAAAGFALAGKQTGVVAVVLTLIWLSRTRGRRHGIRALAFTTVTSLALFGPFLLWHPSSIWWALVVQLSKVAPRMDALTIGAWLTRHGIDAGGAPGVVAAMVFGAAALWMALRPQPLWRLMSLTAVCYFSLYLFGFQAFCNYYWFVAGLIAFSLVEERQHRQQMIAGQA